MSSVRYQQPQTDEQQSQPQQLQQPQPQPQQFQPQRQHPSRRRTASFSSSSKACMTVMILTVLFFFQNLCLVYTTKDIALISREIPCPDTECDFSRLNYYFSNDTILFLDNLWSSRLQNTNITALYYCGREADISIYPCKKSHVRFLLMIFTMLPLLLILYIVAPSDSNEAVSLNDAPPPKYEDENNSSQPLLGTRN